jgi:hypothetical protein
VILVVKGERLPLVTAFRAREGLCFSQPARSFLGTAKGTILGLFSLKKQFVRARSVQLSGQFIDPCLLCCTCSLEQDSEFSRRVTDGDCGLGSWAIGLRNTTAGCALERYLRHLYPDR